MTDPIVLTKLHVAIGAVCFLGMWFAYVVKVFLLHKRIDSIFDSLGALSGRIGHNADDADRKIRGLTAALREVRYATRVCSPIREAVEIADFRGMR